MQFSESEFSLSLSLSHRFIFTRDAFTCNCSRKETCSRSSSAGGAIFRPTFVIRSRKRFLVNVASVARVLSRFVGEEREFLGEITGRMRLSFAPYVDHLAICFYWLHTALLAKRSVTPFPIVESPLIPEGKCTQICDASCVIIRTRVCICVTCKQSFTLNEIHRMRWC